MSFKKFLSVAIIASLAMTLGACKVENKAESNISISNETGSEKDSANKDKHEDIVLSIESIDISDIEGDKTYQTIRYAVVTCENNKALQKSLDVLNANMKKAAEEFKSNTKDEIRQFIKDNPDMKDIESSHTADVTITRNDDKYLSLIEFVYEYAMGAHGNYVQNGYVYDVKTGKELNFTDFIKDKEEFRAFLKKWVKEHNDDYGMFDTANDTIDGYVDGKYDLQFYLTDKMVVVFQPYDVAPYAAGLIEINVDNDLMKVKLNDIR